MLKENGNYVLDSRARKFLLKVYVSIQTKMNPGDGGKTNVRKRDAFEI